MVFGTLLALVLGGRPAHLLDVRLRAPILLFLAVIVRYGTELALRLDLPAADTLRLPLFALGFGILLYALWLNRYHRDPHIVGASIILNRKTYSIIGVMPRNFEFSRTLHGSDRTGFQPVRFKFRSSEI